MKVNVDPNLCIGCGQCIYVAEEVFKWSDDGTHAAAISEEVKDSNKDKATEAMESCPTNAIKEKKDKAN